MTKRFRLFGAAMLVLTVGAGSGFRATSCEDFCLRKFNNCYDGTGHYEACVQVYLDCMEICEL